MESDNKKIIEKFESEGNFDSKHINNLSTKRVPTALLDEIEKGCSIETLEKLAADFPICKYKTQITIHGLFETPTTSRVGYYKNLVQNQNKSLGIRWSAIDVDKKDKLYETLHIINKEWRANQTSECYYGYKSHLCADREDAIEKYKVYKAEAEKIDTTLFVGTAGADAFCYFGLYYVTLRVNVLCYYMDNFDKILDNITGTTPEERRAMIEEYRAQQAREEEERKVERERQAREYAEKKAQEEKVIAEWIIAHPLPECYEKRENYTLQAGDVICSGQPTNTSYRFATPEVLKWTFKVISKSFGRLIATPCNDKGEKERYAKGTAIEKPLCKEVWVLRQTTPARPKTTPQAAKTTQISNKTTASGQIPTAQPKAAKITAKTQTSGCRVIEYSEKAFAVVGDTKPFAAVLKSNGGKFNPRLSCGAGWVFSKKKNTQEGLMKLVGG